MHEKDTSPGMHVSTDPFESTKPEEIAGLIGKHIIYTYDNGWQYEIYTKNERRVDYRIHSGLVAGRWVKNQEAHIVRLADNVFQWFWDEPTGTIVSLAVNLSERRVHGSAFFPQWVMQDPKKTVVFQNEHLDEMFRYRDAGPTYPKVALDEFAPITFIEDCGRDNEEVIACAPDQLPQGYASRRN
jgi:phenolic acid decarboxylase